MNYRLFPCIALASCLVSFYSMQSSEQTPNQPQKSPVGKSFVAQRQKVAAQWKSWVQKLATVNDLLTQINALELPAQDADDATKKAYSELVDAIINSVKGVIKNNITSVEQARELLLQKKAFLEQVLTRLKVYAAKLKAVQKIQKK
ncbi:MAG TPA: hypothetical protein VEK38_03445 [Candidatus Bathyarchaeia archaeon]|nr:hypothetical protein [Candidatus Bathyarchaeia archaeon]